MMEFIAATMRREEALVTIADQGRTVTLKVKFFDFEIMSRGRSMPGAVATRDDLERISVGLLEATMPLQRAVRLLGVSLSSPQAGDNFETQFGLPI